MNYLFLGIFGFILLFIYDINSIIWKYKIFHKLFFIGLLLICFSTGATIWMLKSSLLENIRQNFIWFGLVLIFMSMLIYSLFFALPFDATYLQENGEKKVYHSGVYALCRHPGVLWFIGLYFSLYLMVKEGHMLNLAIYFSIMNILYIVFQDLWTFPKTFKDYSKYIKSTPFLVPNIRSVRQCLSTISTMK